MDDMNVGLIKYDAARKAIAAAHRVDEVKSIRDKAEAVRVYAKQAGDFGLQNQAAEIRLFAERRAGRLLLDMAKNPGTKGEGRPRKDGRKRRSSSTTTNPPKLSDLGISKDQSSKWQRIAQMMDDAEFEKAISLAKARDEELTTAALLRAIKEVLKPEATVIAEPNINLVATELIRDIESASRTEKLAAVVQKREQLNPTIRKKLMLALKNAVRNTADFEEQLSSGFQDFPNNGKAHQRIIRERMAEQPDPLLEEKKALATDFKNAVVREITLAEARNLVVAAEWLGNCGSGEHAFGLMWGRFLGGVVIFGSNAGSNLKTSVCGAEHAHRVAVLIRGCSEHWSHEHSASFLITEACKQMTKLGKNVFIGIADKKAGEQGIVYRSVGWDFCGPTTGSIEMFRRPDGKVYDARNVHLLTRDRTGGTLKFKRNRAEQKKLLIEEGCEFFKDNDRKLRYVGIYGDRRTKRILRAALKWPVLPYPVRQQSTDVMPERGGLIPPEILTSHVGNEAVRGISQ
jgi:hypothetical protein